MGRSMPSQLKTLWKFSHTTWKIALVGNEYMYVQIESGVLDPTLT